jgi:RNA-directed DNA polymerase
VHAFLDTIRGIVKGNKQATTGNLIMQLNPITRGWAQYHQHGASKRTFVKVDHEIFTLLWQWVRRRHPHKSRHWIRDKYFRTEGENNWAFFGQVMGAKGTLHDVHLCRASSVPIRRHTKIKGKPTRMIRRGSLTLKLVRACVWLTILRVDGSCFACGRSKAVCVGSAINALPH